MTDQFKKSKQIAPETTKINQKSILKNEIFVKPFIFDETNDSNKIYDLNESIAQEEDIFSKKSRSQSKQEISIKKKFVDFNFQQREFNPENFTKQKESQIDQLLLSEEQKESQDENYFQYQFDTILDGQNLVSTNQVSNYSEDSIQNLIYKKNSSSQQSNWSAKSNGSVGTSMPPEGFQSNQQSNRMNSFFNIFQRSQKHESNKTLNIENLSSQDSQSSNDSTSQSDLSIDSDNSKGEIEKEQFKLIINQNLGGQEHNIMLGGSNSEINQIPKQQKMKKEKKKKKEKEIDQIKRNQYEDIVINSAPFFLVKFYMRNYGKILIFVSLIYIITVYAVVKFDMLAMKSIEMSDFFIQNHTSTQQYFTLRQLLLSKSFEYSHELDLKQWSGSFFQPQTLNFTIKSKSNKTQKQKTQVFQENKNELFGLQQQIQLNNKSIQQEQRYLIQKDEEEVRKYLNHMDILDGAYSNILIIFACQDKCMTILDSAHIKEMQKFTRKAIDDEIWPRICYRNNNQRKVDSYQCSESAYENLTRYIEPYIDTFTDLQIQNYISNFIKSQDIFNQAKVSLDKDFTLNHPYSKYLGVKLKFAGPVQDTQWVEKIDNKNKSYFQEEAVKDLESLETRALIKNFLSNVYEKACNFKSDKVKVWALNHDLFVAKETEAVEQDKIYTFYIALFVWLYLSLHQRSLFLGTFSILQIIASIPISLVIFKYILRIEYFCQLHLFVIIVIMGIGADDIFVFHDQWQHTKCIRILRKRLILRLAYTMRKATNAMLVTSITTAVSFLATCISPIMPIVSFGLFAALVISVNFLLIILVLPNIYLLYENHLRKRFQCFNFIYKKLRKCFRNLKNLKKQKQRTDKQDQVIQNGPLNISQDLKDDNINSFQKQLQNFQMAINDSSLDIMLLENDDQNSSTENENHDQQIDKTEDFENDQMKEGGEISIVKEEWDSQYQEFEEENTQIIQNKVTVQFNQNLKTKVLSSHHRKKNNNNQNFNSLEMLKESQSKHINYNDYVFKKKGIIMNLFEKYFGKSVFVLRVPIILLSFIWLIFSIYFAFNIPRLMLKQTFLSKSHPVQQALDIVDTHFGLNEEKTLFLNIIFGLKDQLYDLNKTNSNTFWNRNQIGVPVFDAFFDLSPEKNQELMLELCDQIQTSEYIKQIKNEKQINCPLQDFKNYLLLKKQVFPVPQQDFNRSIIEYHKFSNDQNLYIIDNKLRCVKINFHVIDVESYKFQIKMDVYQYYQHIITDIQRKWPQGINQVMQVPYDQWAFLNLEDSMFTNAMSGMICSIIFSFLVLLITTHNYVVSFYSIIAILMVISTIFSTIYFQGLGIGIAESIALIVFIGFSVDYIVHMCHQYNESVYDQKKNRVETCFQKIGVTITDAAVTSFVAGIFLYKCQFNYLHQFGIFMMVTISSSLFFSLIFFPALCYQVGPEFKQGDIKHNFIMPVKKWLAKRRLQRIKKTYKRFQKRFYKKQFDHVNSDSDEEDQNTINLRKISIEEQKTQEMLSIHENSQLNSQQQRLFRLSQKNKQRLIYLSLKGKIKYRKIKKLFREDIRYFRKHLGMYYEGVKDKYDEDYMFMDSFGKELEGSKLEQFFLAKSLEDNLNIDGTMKDVIIIANAQETYMQLEKMDLESGNQIQMSDNSFVDEQDQIQENQILPEEPDKIQIKNNQSNQFFVENQIHLNVQENPLQQNFNEFLQKKMELRHFRSIMKFQKNMQNVFMIENEDFKNFQEQQKQNLNLQLMEKYKNEEEKDISNFGKSKRSKTDHYSQTYIQNIKNNLIIGEQAQQQVQNNQILQKPKTSKKYFNVQKIQKDIQAQLKKLQNTITKNRSFLKRSSSQSKEKKQKYIETEDKKENSHQKSQKSQNSFFSDSESNDNSEDEYEEYIYQKYFQQKSQQENIHDKTKLTVEEDTKNIEFEENDSQTQFQTKYLFKSQILAEDNI